MSSLHVLITYWISVFINLLVCFFHTFAGYYRLVLSSYIAALASKGKIYPSAIWAISNEAKPRKTEIKMFAWEL